MIAVYEFMALVTLVMVVYCLIEIITSEDGAVPHLPKLVWILIVVIIPFGWIVWLVVSRSARSGARPTDGAYERSRPDYSEYDRPGRLAAPDPEADAEFLRRCRARAEEQRRKAPGRDHPDPDPPA
ncbi:MAG: PLD nuclease N-terminal domain-containing protein [Actinomycetota bacterium]|nr:PLD nuclease N-terminal domain-containing protein [Actinomycetota bacterium]